MGRRRKEHLGWGQWQAGEPEAGTRWVRFIDREGSGWLDRWRHRPAHTGCGGLRQELAPYKRAVQSHLTRQHTVSS